MGYFLIIILLATTPSAVAAPWCKPKHQKGQDCWVKIKDLRPTQAALGMVDMEAKAEEIRELSRGDVKDYLKKNPVKIVIGPRDEFYLVDGHHHARALWENDYGEMRAQVLANYSDLSEKEFLEKMKKEAMVRLVDENGKVLKKISDLPGSIGKLPDDPYRSLAWLLRKSGAIIKTDVPFAEFYWADFLREHVRIGPGKKGMKKAFNESLLVMSRENCRKLPGYVKKHASSCRVEFHKECKQAFKLLGAL